MEFYKSRNFDKKKPHSKFGSDRKPSFSYRNSKSKRNPKFSKNGRRGESATVTCADCGTECEIPFVPKHDRPVYCSDCFRQNKAQDSVDDHYSGHEKKFSSKNIDGRRTKSKTEKNLKRQKLLYSGGSEKFYASLKEKLFEILGGKICSSCGFKDERALGVCHIYDDAVFDNIRRGGFASSWGKYISEPDLARQELRVLCLNCNEIRQPISSPNK